MFVIHHILLLMKQKAIVTKMDGVRGSKFTLPYPPTTFPDHSEPRLSSDIYFQSDMILSFVLFLCLTVKSQCTTPPLRVKVQVQKNDF